MEITVRDHKNPILLTFPQNVPPGVASMDMQLMVQDREVKDTTKLRRAITMRNQYITYVGKSERLEAPQWLVGLSNGTSIDVYPTFDHFTMKQYVHKSFGTNESLLTQNTLDQKLTHFQQQVMVAEEMGTNKSRRKVNAMKQKNNRVQEANISQAKQTQELFISKQDELQEKIAEEQNAQKQEISDARRELLPHFNPGATSAKDIYDITSLITEDDIENIDVQMLYVGVVKKPDRLLPTIRHFQELTQNLILDNLVKLQTRTATEIILYLKHSVFLDTMLLFCDRKQFTARDSDAIAYMLKTDQKQVVRTVLAKFYQAAKKGNGLKYTRSTILNDKFICHLIVLMLTLTEYTFDGDKLSQLLQVPANRFMTYAKQCGCSTTQTKTKSGETTLRVKLNVPLKLE